MSTTSDAATRPKWTPAISLALVAGYVDSFTLLNFGVYTSFMSGNTTQAGMHAGKGLFSAAGHQFLPIPLFVLGIIVGTVYLQYGFRRPVSRLCWFIAALLALSSAATIFLGSVAELGNIVVLSMGMGIMNTAITRVGGQSVSLGFVTGDLKNFGEHLALAVRGVPLKDPQAAWDTHWWRAGVLASIWASFLIGAMLAGSVMLCGGKWSLLPPFLLLCFLALWSGENRPAASKETTSPAPPTKPCPIQAAPQVDTE